MDEKKPYIDKRGIHIDLKGLPPGPGRLLEILGILSEAGIKLWGASAFKRADGCMADVPDLDARVENMLSWLKLHDGNSFKSIISTGWSRYRTFLAPCESLESSLDSLVMSARAMREGSLGSDCILEARKFLQTGKMAELAGKRFFHCLDSSIKLKQWREKCCYFMMNDWASLPLLYGEKSRINDYDIMRIARQVDLFYKEGEKFAEEWSDAHKSFIDEVWLDEYIKSRLYPAACYKEKMTEIVLSRSRHEKQA